MAKAKLYDFKDHPHHKDMLEPWATKWIANAMSTKPMDDDDRAVCREAALALYKAAGLAAPKFIVFVPSPFVLSFAGGFAASIWYGRKSGWPTWDATGAATWAATRDATWAATGDATRDATGAATRAATRDATRDATGAATGDATRDATGAATWAATWAATRDATWAAAGAATWAATGAAAGAATRAATWAATGAATWAAAGAAAGAATWDATGAATRAAAGAATWDATGAATRAATGAATRAATWAATRAATGAATRAATRAATGDATGAATWAATGDATRDATRAATGAATRDATRAAQAENDLSKWYVIPANMTRLAHELGVGDFGLRCAANAWNMWQYGNQDSGYDAYLSFFQDVAKLGLDYSKYSAWRTLCERSGPRIMHTDFCMISDRPEVLTVDEQGRPHGENGPFCRWRDGSALYSWHGSRIPAAWIEHRTTLDPNEVIKHENVELRAAGAAIVGWPRMLSVLKAKVIEDSGSPDIGQLIELRLPGLQEAGRFLKAACPRNGIIVEGVPRVSDIDGLPINTALHAQAWRIGDSLSDYQHPEIRT